LKPNYYYFTGECMLEQLRPTSTETRIGTGDDNTKPASNHEDMLTKREKEKGAQQQSPATRINNDILLCLCFVFVGV